jgi:hypothetical protein
MAVPAEGAIPVETVGTLLTNMLQDGGIIGLDEAPEAEQLNRAFRQVNWLIAQWARKRWLVYRIQDYSFVSNGSLTYPVGAIGANVVGINISPRPDRIEYAFLRFLNGPTPGGLAVDPPLQIVQSHEDYARILVKSVGTFPQAVFYDPEWPVGVLRPWPIPQGGGLYEIHLGFKVVLPRFTAINQPINFPPEYSAALNWAGARRLRASYQLPADPEVTSLARDALNVIRLANSAVGVLQMPAALRRRGRAYDYRGDTNA